MQSTSQNTITTDRRAEVLRQLRLEHLHDEKSGLTKKVCLDFFDISYLEGDHLIFTNEIKHTIDTNNTKPVFTKSYRYPYVYKEEVKTLVSKMLERPSNSPWTSPVWAVPKKLDATGK